MVSNLFTRYNSFYFIGICGVSMSALAKYCISLHKKTGGSDRDLSGAAHLKSLGALVNGGGTRALEGYEVVVYTDAVGRSDGELKLARSLSKIIVSRGKLLAEMQKNFARTIAVSGCHGKTTCTGMLASVFAAAGQKFAAHIGGESLQFSNFFYSGNNFFITEACEYKKNFLCLQPDTAVVLSTDADHLECYSCREELENCYHKFAARAFTAVVPCVSLLAKRLNGDVVTFGEGGDFCADNISHSRGRYEFTLKVRGKPVTDIKLAVCGRHNIYNALAAAAAADAEGITFPDIKSGLESFSGTERRMEHIGGYRGIEFIADYAHHPAEITSALVAVREIAQGNIFVIFQPHTYSRTKNLFDRFVQSLSQCENLMIYRTFAAREYFDAEGSALTLADGIEGAAYGESVEDIKKFLSRAKTGDTALFLGAGDIYFIAKDIVKNS